jgi:hypothetical protein
LITACRCGLRRRAVFLPSRNSNKRAAVGNVRNFRRHASISKTPMGPFHIDVSIFLAVIHRACRQTSLAGYKRNSLQFRTPLYGWEMPMTSEMTERSYRAVRCIYCSEPIPLSTNLLSLSGVESERMICRSQVFILRCDDCSRESRYLKSEIEAFEGDPTDAGKVNRAAPRHYPRSLRKAAGQ